MGAHPLGSGFTLQVDCKHALAKLAMQHINKLLAILFFEIIWAKDSIYIANYDFGKDLMALKIQYSPLTKGKLQQSLNGHDGYFKLVSDSEESRANGLYSIHLVNEPLDTDLEVETEDHEFSFLVDRGQESLFEDTVRLHAYENFPTFRLSSDSMLYNDHVVLKDKRSDIQTLQ